ncbi:unnamed protein product [Lactuca saligna]|uniref:Uncharacterized protein n=1 Tax=Lactuca saligna TaxID=75948 RepID=A0AA36A404_LACSI|nr:unnamed protein product [Lactuca saligna]
MSLSLSFEPIHQNSTLYHRHLNPSSKPQNTTIYCLPPVLGACHQKPSRIIAASINNHHRVPTATARSHCPYCFSFTDSIVFRSPPAASFFPSSFPVSLNNNEVAEAAEAASAIGALSFTNQCRRHRYFFPPSYPSPFASILIELVGTGSGSSETAITAHCRRYCRAMTPPHPVTI